MYYTVLVLSIYTISRINRLLIFLWTKIKIILKQYWIYLYTYYISCTYM